MKISTCIKLIILGALLLGAGLLVRKVRYETSPPRVRQALQDEFQRALDADLALGQVRFELNGTLHAQSVRVTAPGQETPLFECRRLVAAFDRRQMLRMRQIVRKLTLVRPTFRLLHLAEERQWNVQALGLQPGGAGRPAPGLLADGIVIENGALVVSYGRLFKDPKPRRYEGLYLRLSRDTGAPHVWRLEGQILRGPLEGTRLRGFFAGGRPRQFRLQIEADKLQADEAFWHYIPHGSKVWRDYRPEGLLTTKGTVASRPDGSISYSLTVGTRGATAKTKFFPARAESVHGTVLISDTGVEVRDMVGRVPVRELGVSDPDRLPVQIRADGTSGPGQGHYTVRAQNVPICRRTIEAIPGAGPEVWRRLRPDGNCDLALTIRPTRERGTTFRAEADLRGSTLRPAEVPAPLRDVSGTVIVDGGGITMRGIRGSLGREGDSDEVRPGARFAVDGHVAPAQEKADLDLRFHNLHTDEELIRSIPTYGDRIWEAAHPEVALDGRVLLQQEAGEDGRTSCSADLQLHGGRAQLGVWPMPMELLSGTLRLRGPELAIEGLRMELAPRSGAQGEGGGHVEASARVQLAKGKAAVNVRARDLNMEEPLVTSIPGIGTEIWEEIMPAGVASLEGTITYERARGNPVTCALEIDLHDVAISSRSMPVPVQGLSGRILVTERRAMADRLTGVACAGQVDAAIVAYYGVEGEYPTYAGTIEFRQVDLAELLGALEEEPPEVSGTLSGTADVGGILGGGTGVRAEGQVALTGGRLWEAPFFTRLVNVLHLSLPSRGPGRQRGDALFSLLNGVWTIDEFEITGGGLSVSGYGTVKRNRELDLTMAVVGAPEPGGGIPVISSVVGWLMRGVERELFRVEVSGTLDDPRFKPKPLMRIMSPITSVRSILVSPLFAPEGEEGD
ncbi:MAG: hypothetical protein PVJ27_10430 [Candidatus Brocadiaceae bacterium]|jgi:hypothetical protein